MTLTNFEAHIYLGLSDSRGADTGRPNFFSAHSAITPSSTLSATTPVNKLSIPDSEVIVNRGMFSVESGTNSLNAIQVSETGTYLVEFNIHIIDDAGPTTGRAQIQGDIVIIRAGVMQTDFTARTSMYWRGQNDTDEIYISGTHTVDLLADDQIEIHFSTGDTETISWIIGGGESEISIVRLSGGGGGTSGQASPQAAGANAPNGLHREKVYQAIASGLGLPLDPPAIWNTTTAEFEDDFSPWSRTPPTLTANQILAVADGFSILDDQDVRQNGAWAKFFSLTEQYCSIIQDNSTYTLDGTVAGLRFSRSLLANGWGAWGPLENGNDGWVEIFSDINAYSGNASNIDGNLITPIDCTYFDEIEFDFRTHGMADGGNPGGRAQWHYRRTEGNWSDRLEAALNHTGLGSFKLWYYDEFGFNGIAAQSANFRDDFIGNIGSGVDQPTRRYSFLFHLNIEGVLTPNLINGYQIGPFSGANQYSTLTVRMR